MKKKLSELQNQCVAFRKTAASKMLVLFTAIAVIIALVSVIGLATYNVIKRKKEIGIKRVFGASSVQLLGLES